MIPNDKQLEGLRDALREFAAARDWEQFHSPKNLAMALAAETGELLEVFQWLTEEQSRGLDARAHAAVSEEIGDVLLYLVRLADNALAREGRMIAAVEAIGRGEYADEAQVFALPARAAA